MNKNEASFKALREMCGFSQSDIADEFDVSVGSVKKWENPAYQRQVPDEIWEWLIQCHDALMLDVADSVSKIVATSGEKPVSLQYFRTQEQLDSIQLDTGIDEPIGYANTRMRLIALELERREVPYSFHFQS